MTDNFRKSKFDINKLLKIWQNYDLSVFENFCPNFCKIQILREIKQRKIKSEELKIAPKRCKKDFKNTNT